MKCSKSLFLVLICFVLFNSGIHAVDYSKQLEQLSESLNAANLQDAPASEITDVANDIPLSEEQKKEIQKTQPEFKPCMGLAYKQNKQAFQ